MPGFCRAEHQGPALDVVVDGLRRGEQVLEVVGVISVDRQYFFPCSLVEDQLQGPGSGWPGSLTTQLNW